MDPDETVEDRILGGKILLRQPKHGFRASLDALLLAAAAPPATRALDAGCGAGTALLAAAWRMPETIWVGVERDPAMAALARNNVAANGLMDRVSIDEGDVFSQSGGGFDLVQCNPPFAEEGEGSPPHPARAGSHVTEASLNVWVAALSNRLAGGGVLTLIHRADRLDRILKALDGRLGGARIYPVFTRREAPAQRVLVRAHKGSRAPLVILRGLDLTADKDRADAIVQGEAAIDW